MPTYYGLKCKKCNESWIGEGVHEEDAQKLLEDIHDLAILQYLKERMKTDIDISFDFLYQGFHAANEVLLFASEHHRHKLVVVDEYGEEMLLSKDTATVT